MKKFFEKHNFFIFLLFNLLMIWIFALLLFSLSDSVHAAETYFPMDQNINGNFDSGCVEAIFTSFDSSSNYIFAKFYEHDSVNHRDLFYVMVVPKSSSGMVFGEIYSNGYQFSLYTYGDTSNFGYAFCDYDSTGLHWISVTSISSFSDSFSSYYSQAADYVSNFSLRSNSSDNYDVVLRLRKIGHEPKPPRDSQEDPIYSSGDSAPSIVPNSSGSSSDTSLLAKTLQYYGNLINQNNNSNFQNLYENLLPQYYVLSQFYYFGLDEDGNFTLTSAIGNLFEYLFIPDPDELTDLIESYDEFGIIDFAELSSTYWGNVKTLVTSGDSLFNIKINAFSIMGVVCGPYYVDFSWYLPFKPIGDAMISAFLVFGWFVWVYHRLPYWLRGQQGDVSGVITEVNKK